MPRTTKTPTQRAEEALGLARRHHERVLAKHERAQATASEHVAELTAARDRLAYAAQDPALPDVARDETQQYLSAVETAEVPAEAGLLLEYGKWLDAEGLIVADETADDETRTHEVLVADFLRMR